MDIKQDNLEPVLPTAVTPVDSVPKTSDDLSTVKPEVSYDFNFEKQTAEQPVVAQTPEVVATPSVVVPDPAIGQVNPNPVMPENIVPIDVDTAAGTTIATPVVKPVASPVVQANIKTSGTATEEEIIIDATKGTAEVLDEYAITMDAAAEKAKNKKNDVFIGVVFGVIILFIILLRVIIGIVGY